MNTKEIQNVPHVVVIGAGFGGLRAARFLRGAPVRVTLVDRNNYHLFQPLLYQVATAGLSPNDIAYPVRAIFRRQRNFDFHLGEVTRIDPDRRIVETSTGPLDYDYLVLAPGGETNYFGNESIAEHATGLKEIGDAIHTRNRLLRLFELAAQCDDPVERRAMLTFVVVGGGPTGVEMSGSLSELIRLVLQKDFPQHDLTEARVILLEAADRLLPGMPADLAEHTVKVLERRHVEVQLNTTVSDYDGRTVRLKTGETIPARTLIWAAGIKAEGILATTGAPTARQGRLVVTPTLQIPDRPEVFVIGDAAYLEDEHGQPLPMVAPVAMQQAETAAKNIQHILAGEPLEPFRYRDPGSLATIGRNQAVAQLGRFKFTGYLAWVVWLVVHLIQLIGFRNRLIVLINWAVDYIFYQRAVRLIVPTSEEKILQREFEVQR
ncbi:MAG TPA: NAD(P)/FAD-dependent oxidoreductase [Anaerolineaceae bacterium]|nr:NAD(P)/FAD-dependent oxidoreductase [Anaerolineaceae bacterium]